MAKIVQTLTRPSKVYDQAVADSQVRDLDAVIQKLNTTYQQDLKEEFQNVTTNDDHVLLDLREDSEIYHDGKIHNSIHVPFDQVSDYLIKEKENLQGKKILMYCAVGHRSTLAVQVSKSYDYKNCYHLMGGLKNWIAQGNSIEKKDHH